MLRPVNSVISIVCDQSEVGVIRYCSLYFAVNVVSRSRLPFSRRRARMESGQAEKFSAVFLKHRLEYLHRRGIRAMVT